MQCVLSKNGEVFRELHNRYTMFGLGVLNKINIPNEENPKLVDMFWRLGGFGSTVVYEYVGTKDFREAIWD